MTSPLLGLPGAVGGDGIDAGVAAHYGSFNGEQRALEAADGFVDLSHRDVVRISGPDRLTWLHSLTTQYFEGLAAGVWTEALILSPQGHVEHAFAGVDDGEAFTAHTEPGQAAALVGFLDRMRFLMRVEVADVTDEVAIAWRPATAPTRRTTSSPATAWRRTPRRRGSRAACGPSRRCASPAASRGWGSTPTTAPSPTRWAGSGRPCTWTRAATAVRRPWRACTRSAGRRAG